MNQESEESKWKKREGQEMVRGERRAVERRRKRKEEKEKGKRRENNS